MTEYNFITMEDIEHDYNYVVNLYKSNRFRLDPTPYDPDYPKHYVISTWLRSYDLQDNGGELCEKIYIDWDSDKYTYSIKILDVYRSAVVRNVFKTYYVAHNHRILEDEEQRDKYNKELTKQ